MKNLLVTLLAIVLLFGCAGATKKNLHIPAGNGELQKVKAEINSGKDINSKDAAGQTALMYASESGQLDVVKYLVENGAAVNAQSNGYGNGTALIYASTNDRIAVMEYLLEHGADVNATTPIHKETALFWAAAFGRVKAVNLLLKNNADTKIKTKKGQTALEVAKECNREEVELILSGK